MKGLNNNDTYKYIGITSSTDEKNASSFKALHKICKLFASSILKENINEDDDERDLRYNFPPNYDISKEYTQ